MTNTVHTWFPTLIYRNELEYSIEQNKQFADRALEIKDEISESKSKWDCGTYNTQNTYNLLDDPVFANLISDCTAEVVEFAKLFGVERPVRCPEAWVNIAGKNDFQEYHIHPMRHFSLVYYVATPENCGKIRFQSQDQVADMFPLPIEQYTQASYTSCHYEPAESSVLIFRSNLSHMVDQNLSDEPRISIAMNFICD